MYFNFLSVLLLNVCKLMLARMKKKINQINGLTDEYES